jgi:hypothetical protein
VAGRGRPRRHLQPVAAAARRRRIFAWCLRTSIAIGDIATARRLRRVYWGRPSTQHAALSAIARLPDRLAQALSALGLRLKAALRRAARPSGAAAGPPL